MEEPIRVLRCASLGFVCSPSFFSFPTASRLSGEGGGAFSRPLLSLRKTKGLLVLYQGDGKNNPEHDLSCYYGYTM